MTSYPSAALFDLDGVLIDTEGIYTEIWTEIERAHPTGIENFAIKIKGSTLERILSTYFPDPAEQAHVCAMLKEREEAMHYRLFDGVASFLGELKAAGIPAAIVTSSGEAKMTRLFGMIDGFRDFFGAVLTDADVERSKPDPEGYCKAARRLGAEPERCIVFEDSFSGLAAGRASGAKVVALATTNSRESLEGKADLILAGFDGVTLEKLLSSL
ncbi:MAG: HAD family phosphatase [Muribaculaceae bacterium]|nr:HAD family phosphatase [Muribaculaceae bacterium]